MPKTRNMETDVSDKENEENVDIADDSTKHTKRKSVDKGKKSGKSKKSAKDSSPATEEANGSKKKTSKSKAKPKKKGKKGNSTDDESEDENVRTLYEAVRKNATSSAAKEWLHDYSEDTLPAMTELINFIIESTGCKESLTLERYAEEEDPQDLVRDIVTEEYLRGVQGDFPLLGKKASSKKFKQHFEEFWRQLIQKCPDDILYEDDGLISKLNTWLVVLSNSVARPFRLTTTIVGLNLISGLIEVSGRANKKLEIANRQLANEKKSRGNAIQSLTDKASRLNQQCVDLDHYIKELLKGVFTARYRDLEPDIRVVCMQALGEWIISYSALFMDDMYTRYMGWMLNDKSPEVRLSTIGKLIEIYKTESLLANLELFTQRFTERIVEVATRDKDANVSLAAIKLITILDKHEALTEEQVKKMNNLITDPNTAVRHEAADFVMNRLQVEESAPKSKSKIGQLHQDQMGKVRQFIEFVTEETAVPENPNYAIDALWGKFDELTNWGAMTELLLTDENLTEANQLLLVKTIVACGRKAAGKSIVQKAKNDPEKPDRKAVIEQNVENLTNHFIKGLPELLKKYQADTKILRELVEIPQYFALGLYESSRQKKYFAELLNLLSEEFSRSTDTQVLEGISMTFRIMHDSDKKFQSDIRTKIEELSSSVMGDLGTSDDPQVLTVQLSRAALLTKQYYTEIDPAVLDTLRQYLQSDNYEVVGYVMDLMFYRILHEYSLISPQNVRSDDVRSVAAGRDTLFGDLQQAFSNSQDPTFKLKIYFKTCELLKVFAAVSSDTALGSLSYSLNDEFSGMIEEFIENQLEVPEVEANIQLEDEALSQVETVICEGASAIGCGGIKKEIGVPILMQWGNFGKKSDEFIRVMLSTIRERFPREEFTVMFPALKRRYEKMSEEEREPSQDEEEVEDEDEESQVEVEDEDENEESQDENVKKRKKISKKKNSKKTQKKVPAKNKEKSAEKSKKVETKLDKFKKFSTRLALSYGINIPEPRLMESLRDLIKFSVEYAISDVSRYSFLSHGVQRFVSKFDRENATIFLTWIDETVMETAKNDNITVPDRNNKKHKGWFSFYDALVKVKGSAKSPKRPRRNSRKSIENASVAKALTFDTPAGTPAATPIAKEKRRNPESEEESEEEALTKKQKKPKKTGKKQKNSEKNTEKDSDSDSENLFEKDVRGQSDEADEQ